MRKYTTLATILGLIISWSSFSQEVLSWKNVEKKQNYILKPTAVPHPQLGQIQLPNYVKVTAFRGLDMINVSLIKFKAQTCFDPSIVFEMELVTVGIGERSTEVGIIGQPDCHYELYIENVDLDKPSFFMQEASNETL